MALDFDDDDIQVPDYGMGDDPQGDSDEGARGAMADAASDEELRTWGILPPELAVEQSQAPPGTPEERRSQPGYIEHRYDESLDVTWCIFDEEPGMDDIYERAGNSLETITDQMGYQIFQTWQMAPRLFHCRYEFLSMGGSFRYPDGRDPSFHGDVKIYLDFLTGFPIDCIELLFMVAEYSSLYTKEQISKMAYGSGATPPVPASFFEGYDPDRILVNITAIDREMSGGEYYGVHLVEGLSGAAEPKNIKWFARTNIPAEDKFPIPGEFVALGVRMMPGDLGGTQQTSPFIYAGNWIDAPYYTSGEVLAVDDSGDYPIYTVRWRKWTLRIPATDYAPYAVGDRVTILKNCRINKGTQTWEDDDALNPREHEWVIAPIMFYGIEYGAA